MDCQRLDRTVAQVVGAELSEKTLPLRPLRQAAARFRSHLLSHWMWPLNPVNRHLGYLGYERGMPLDRYYIERFLKQHGNDIRGTVLEAGGNGYTTAFGAATAATALVLSAGQSRQTAELVADLSHPELFPESRFDAFLCPQTFQYVDDVQAAVRSCYRTLKPNGVFLGTMPAICQKSTLPRDAWHDQWRFSRFCLERLFSDSFGSANVEVRAFGNVKVAAAFLYGLPLEDMPASVMDYVDADYECLITVYAKKPRS